MFADKFLLMWQLYFWEIRVHTPCDWWSNRRRRKGGGGGGVVAAVVKVSLWFCSTVLSKVLDWTPVTTPWSIWLTGLFVVSVLVLVLLLVTPRCPYVLFCWPDAPCCPRALFCSSWPFKLSCIGIACCPHVFCCPVTSCWTVLFSPVVDALPLYELNQCFEAMN